MLANMKDLMKDAQQKKYALGAFNCPTFEAIRAVVGAAEELGAPVIIQHAQVHDNVIDLLEIAPVMLYYAKKATVPVAVHLDHGSSFERCVQAIRAGFTSIMYDASSKDFETNLEETREMVKIAHAAGVSVEAELGTMFNSEVGSAEGAVKSTADDYDDLDKIYTDPDTARDFVKATGVDCLAIAFGTVHGVYLTEPKLDLPRVARIRDAAGIPLVMHGGSGVSLPDYRTAITNGICKINYYTYMNKAGGEAVREAVAKASGPVFIDELSLCATDAMKQDAKNAIVAFQNK